MTLSGRINRRQFLQISACATIAIAARVGHAETSPDASLTSLTLAQAAQRIHAGQVTSVALTQAVLARIDALNPKLNAFITVMRESALRQAAAMDAEAAAGKLRGPLHGIPLAIKDNIDTAGTRTTMASAVFDDRVPTADAFVIERLRAAGAVLVGKTNLHEFAMGGTSATSYFGPVRNPWALDRVPGGSSGGSAAAVSAELTFGALGTDTGGSIRIPSAWCGIVGLKPTYGLVSLRGIFPLIYSLDHCGPMARAVADTALLLEAMVGYDRQDVASVQHTAEPYSSAMQKVNVAGLRIGIPREPFFDGLDADTAHAMEEALGVIRTLVRETRDVRLPATSSLDWTAIRAAEVGAAQEDLFRRHGDGYSLQTRRVVEGTLKELNDPAQTGSSRIADLVHAQTQLALLRRTVDDAFAEVDLVVLPTNRIGPRTIDTELRREEGPTPEEPENPFNSLAFNLYGVPALSLPCGFTGTGLPIGLMIAGPHFSEATVLALGAAFERATGWHTKRPALSATTVVPPIVRLDARPSC